MIFKPPAAPYIWPHNECVPTLQYDRQIFKLEPSEQHPPAVCEHMMYLVKQWQLGLGQKK